MRPRVRLEFDVGVFRPIRALDPGKIERAIERLIPGLRWHAVIRLAPRTLHKQLRRNAGALAKRRNRNALSKRRATRAAK